MNPHSQLDPWIGRLIGDRQRYRIIQRLDSGGMGDVFLAMDILLGQQVALKLLKEKLAVSSEELRKRFEREVALCAALHSDHIVEVSDYGLTAEGHPFYVMEYLRGQSLGQLLRREKHLSVQRTVDIISQVCEGLQLAHKGVTLWRDGATANEHVKVVHRDLKPDNIFLVPTTLGELVKILDFGIARKIRDDCVEQTNLTSTFLGTFRYAAPEQLGMATNLDERADIYSLGIILYEMISGADPFGFGTKSRRTTGVSWAIAHTSKPPQPLLLQPGCEQVSAELEAVVMRCLQKVPQNRFASVEELNQALQAAVKSDGDNIPQPQHPFGQSVPDATIAWIPPVSMPGSDDSTVYQPLAASRHSVPDATIAHHQSTGGDRQEPPKEGEHNTTILQQRTPVRRGVPDVTIAQIPPPPKPVADATTAQSRQSRSLPRHFLLPLGIGIAIGLVMMGAILAYMQLQHRKTVVDDIQTLKAQSKYEECITKAEAVTEDSKLYHDAQMLLNECLIAYAKKLAIGKDFQSAIAVAREIPGDSSLHREAQQLINEWTKQIDESI